MATRMRGSRRRRFTRVSKERAWFLDSGSYSFAYADGNNTRSLEAQVMNFDDIGVDEALIANERSRWVIERILFWFTCRFSPANLSTALGQPMAGFALVQNDPNATAGAGHAKSVTLAEPEWLNDQARVYMHEFCAIYQSRPLTFDGGDLVANGTTADGIGMPWPQQVRKWDLQNVKSRISDQTQLAFCCSFLENAAVANDTIAGNWVAKVLLSRKA